MTQEQALELDERIRGLFSNRSCLLGYSPLTGRVRFIIDKTIGFNDLVERSNKRHVILNDQILLGNEFEFASIKDYWICDTADMPVVELVLNFILNTFK